MITFFARLAQDLRYGVRMLWSKPGFTSVSVLSIALGIGATTAIFSVIYALLIDPYPYKAADRIGQIVLVSKKHPHWGADFTLAHYEELKTRVRSMEDVVAIDAGDTVMTGSGMAQVVRRAQCSANFFDFMGVPPVFGRAFTAPDQRPGRAPEAVAVISYKFWQTAFQGRRDVLGQKIRLNNDIYTVTGVLPIRFTWMDQDAYVPLDPKPTPGRFARLIFRIRPGVSQEQLNAEFQPLLQGFQRQVPRYSYPEDAFKVTFVNVNDGILGKFATTLLVLFGAVTLLLLIGCGNVANLLLARAATREGEMAIRVSLGATRLRLIGQLLTESVLLALTGGIAGIALAYAGVRAVIAFMPEYSIPHEAVIALNWPVLWFAVAVSVLTGVVFGLAPALQAAGTSQADTLRGSGRGSSFSARRRRLHDTLMVAEITLSLVLLTGAGMAIRGLLLLQNQKLGYDPKHAMTFRMPLSEGRYTQWTSRLALYQRITDNLRRTPHVQAAAISSTGTPPYNGFGTRVAFDDRPATQLSEARMNLVQTGILRRWELIYFEGVTSARPDILQGRLVAMISEDMVKRDFSNGRDPIGHHVVADIFKENLPPQLLRAPNFKNSFEIIGVVGTARNSGLSDPATPALFLPFSLLLAPDISVIARTAGDAASLIGPGREAVRAADPDMPITDTRSLERWLETATAYQSFSTFLFGVFGGVGMLLAAAGVFSVVSYSVEHRTREFGIRMALGAEPGHVVRLVLGATGRLLGVALLVGIALSVVASRMLASRMEGMGAGSPLLFVIVPLVLIAATLVASFLPARAATRIAPVEALRHD